MITVFASAFSAGDIQQGNKFFYKKQYKEALRHYEKALRLPIMQNCTIKLACVTFLGDKQRANEFWKIAKSKNNNIFKGKTLRISSGSMMPTLIPGDHIIIDPEYFRHKAVLRGDVIVFKYPEDPKREFIIRIIAIEGDIIESRNKSVYVNGGKLIEPYVQQLDTRNLEQRGNFGTVTVSKRAVLVL